MGLEWECQCWGRGSGYCMPWWLIVSELILHNWSCVMCAKIERIGVVDRSVFVGMTPRLVKRGPRSRHHRWCIPLKGAQPIHGLCTASKNQSQAHNSNTTGGDDLIVKGWTTRLWPPTSHSNPFIVWRRSAVHTDVTMARLAVLGYHRPIETFNQPYWILRTAAPIKAWSAHVFYRVKD